MTNPMTETGEKGLVESLDWQGGDARSSLGDLYSVARLSPIVHTTYKNGTAFPAWKPSIEEARQVAQADYERRIRSALA